MTFKVISCHGNRLGADRWELGVWRCGGVTVAAAVVASPAMAWGSAEYSCTSSTPQSKDAFSFFSLEADGAILNKP